MEDRYQKAYRAILLYTTAHCSADIDSEMRTQMTSCRVNIRLCCLIIVLYKP